MEMPTADADGAHQAEEAGGFGHATAIERGVGHRRQRHEHQPEADALQERRPDDVHLRHVERVVSHAPGTEGAEAPARRAPASARRRATPAAPPPAW